MNIDVSIARPRFAALAVTVASVSLAFATIAASDDALKSAPDTAPRKATSDPATTPKLQLRLDRDDRAALEEAVGFTAPAFPDALEWVGSPALTAEAVRGRVLVLQSLSTRGNWRGVMDSLRKQLGSFEEPPVVMVLHTPENAERARNILEKSLDGWIGLIDSDGTFCDALGVWKRPVNLVIDRNGVVRYAGLTPEGVRAAVEILSAEKADPEAPAKPRPAADAGAAKVEFPAFTDSVGSAADMRGKPAPPLVVESWPNGQPDPGQRLVVIDFWATWCGPCRAAIPHMNELATRYAADACFVGLSDESRSNFEQGCRKHDLKERDFRYAIALDSKARMSQFFGVKGIPHCAVISADGMVRWQGHAARLDDKVLQSLIAANRSLTSGAGKNDGSRGWSKGAKSGSGTGSGGRGAPPKRRSY